MPDVLKHFLSFEFGIRGFKSFGSVWPAKISNVETLVAAVFSFFIFSFFGLFVSFFLCGFVLLFCLLFFSKNTIFSKNTSQLLL